MKYQKFIINTYKGIPKIELDLDKQPQTNIFTLVGLNESAKTTILEAINRFGNDIRKEAAYSLIPKSKQHSFTGSISISAALLLEPEDLNRIKEFLKNKYQIDLVQGKETISIEKRYNFDKSSPTNEKWSETFWTTILSCKPKRAKKEGRLYDINQTAWNEVVEIIKNTMVPKILYYPDFLFKFPERIYLEKYNDEGKEQEEYRKIISDILGKIQNDLTLEEDMLNKMKNHEQKAHREALSQLLLKVSSKLNEEILKKWDEIFGSGQKKEVDINWDTDQDGSGITRYFIELKIKQGSDSYSINDRSLGFRWFFSFLIFIAFRKSRPSDPGETLFLLDEPASNLHQRSQQKLLKSLDEIVSDCKLIYSTHSHHLINPRWLAGTYIVRNRAVNYGDPEISNITETHIEAVLYKQFVSSYPKEEDHFKPILDALEYTPSKLEFVPSIIFTEGKNDYYTLKYISEILLNEKNLYFYPGAGVDKYEQIFRLYIAWNKNFIGIFDSDTAGKKAKKNYENAIGPDILNKIYTLDAINPQWDNSQTEKIFLPEDRKNIIQTSFPNFELGDEEEKSKLNTAIQQLYIDKREVKINKRSIENFRKIFDFIKEKLRT